MIDVVFKILSEGYPPSEYQGRGIAAAMIASVLVSVYIFFCYRLTRRRTLYSRSFNLSLLAAGPVTASLILLMSQNAIASIGVVGALAIVRLRGAVKEPMDLAFLLWSIASGIFVASGMWRIAIVTTAVMTATVIFLDYLPIGNAPLVLAVYGHPGSGEDIQKACRQVVESCCSKVRKISTGRTDGKQTLVLSVSTRQRLRLINEIAALPAVESVTLLEQSGEVSF